MDMQGIDAAIRCIYPWYYRARKEGGLMEVKQMKEDIGNAAGEIWTFMDQQPEPVTLSTLIKALPLSSTLLMMGLGWLAREDKLDMVMSGSSYKISLKR
jgi:hypothetical protein